MSARGPIIIIEDDPDDQDLLTDAFKEMGNDHKLIFFANASEALNFLKSVSEQPFLILSDVNMPGKSGIAFKREIDADPQLREKSIPFVFFSTAIKKEEIDAAYEEVTVQGYFKKPSNYTELKKVLQLIMDYWKVCQHPNS